MNRSINKREVTGLLLTLIVIGCNGVHNDLSSITSPDGKFVLTPSEESGQIRLAIVGADGKRLDEAQTGATNNAIWAAGWYQADENSDQMVVLASAEAGTLAWTVSDEGKLSNANADPRIVGFGEALLIKVHPIK